MLSSDMDQGDMPLKKNDYTVVIEIKAGRHYACSNMKSVISIRVGPQRKWSETREASPIPAYNQVFMFDFNLTFPELLEMIVTITVYQPKKNVTKKKRLGSCRLELATVWAQNDHTIENKWFTITEPKDPTGSVKGFIKCSIKMIGKDLPKHQVSYTDIRKERKHDIRGKMLFPEKYSMGKFKAKYTINIYRAEGCTNVFRNKATKLDTGLHMLKRSRFTSFVRVIFCGLTAQTTSQRNPVSQIWNEELAFSETFPPLYDRMRISFHQNKHNFATRYICLSQISNPAIKGFVPSFGPTFMYFYRNEYEFMGAAIISVDTLTVKAFKEKEKLLSVNRRLVYPLMETLYWKTEEFVLFGAVFELSMIRKKRLKRKHNTLTITINFGPAGYLKPPNEGKLTMTTSLFLRNVDEKYKCVKLDSNPVLYIKDKLPDNRNRLLNSNRLEKIILGIELYIDKARLILETDPDDSELNKILTEGFRYIKRECSKDSITMLPGTTKLDKERISSLRNRLDSIISRVDLFFMRNIPVRRKLIEMTNISEELKRDLENPQDSLPKVVIGVWQLNKLISYSCVDARDILHSVTPKEKGKNSGVIQTVILKDAVNKRFGGKLDVFLWLGIYSSIGYCLESLPKGVEGLSTITDIPQQINYLYKSEYTLRAYIFQGHLEPQRCAQGLCSSYVKVILQSHSKTTGVYKKSFCPEWEETLTLPGIDIIGSNSEEIEALPTVVTEVWNQINVNKNRLIGRFMCKPTLVENTKEYTPPSLIWFKVEGHKRDKGEILAAFEIKKSVPEDHHVNKKLTTIPDYIKPKTDQYRLEILFWGIRKNQPINIQNPQISINCGHSEVQSEILREFSNDPNFEQNLVFMDIVLPKDKHFAPPLVIRLFENKHFGIFSYCGDNVVRNIYQFKSEVYNIAMKNKYLMERQHLLQKQQDKDNISDKKSIHRNKGKSETTGSHTSQTNTDVTEEEEPLILKKADHAADSVIIEKERESIVKRILKVLKRTITCKCYEKSNESITALNSFQTHDQNKDIDWWTKYNEFFKKSDYHVEKEKKCSMLKLKKREPKEKTPKIVVYPDELENQPQFEKFNDLLKAFNIYPRKSKKRKQKTIKFQFKGAIALYELPEQGCLTKIGTELQEGMFNEMSLKSKIEVPILVRVYVVKAHLLHLHKKDQIRPYVEIKLSKKIVSDYKSYAIPSIDPVFGKVFELEGMLPYDCCLNVRVKNKRNQALIGETIIDIENRFYSRHRATCGIANIYNRKGYNRWRDTLKPSEILQELTLQNNMKEPVYKRSSLVVRNKKFRCCGETEDEKECLALKALKHWDEIALVGCHLVPEHVETRSLYTPDQPDIEHGKLEMWVDIFPMDKGIEPPLPIDISPRKPQEYELRVIIWKTINVRRLNPGITYGRKTLDIFIKGWLTGEDVQKTDVHYTSIKGEGLFNWRFVFPFNYIPTERAIVVKAKSRKANEKEYKIPPILNLQVWDEDKWTPNDFIGYIALDLTEVPLGLTSRFRNPLKSNVHQTINLFKEKKIRGKWHFIDTLKIPHKKHTNLGTVDAEITLLTQDEALENPAGKGRNDPLGLPAPLRPVMKMKFWLTPLKTAKVYFFQYYKSSILKLTFVVFITFFALIFVYSFPIYAAKRILGA